MPDLVLGEREQAAVRAVLAADPAADGLLPGGGLLRHLERLIACDGIGVVLLDATGSALGEPSGHGTVTQEDLLSGTGPVRLGIERRDRAPFTPGSTQVRGVAYMTLGVRSGTAHVAKLWMTRHASDFTERDRALLWLIAPALERVLRERPPTVHASLTVQELRVLQLVAVGLSNAEIAVRLVVAASTVRKHLEHAYRKLGVTNRLAAVVALEGAGRPDVDTGSASPAGSFVGVPG